MSSGGSAVQPSTAALGARVGAPEGELCSQGRGRVDGGQGAPPPDGQALPARAWVGSGTVLCGELCPPCPFAEEPHRGPHGKGGGRVPAAVWALALAWAGWFCLMDGLGSPLPKGHCATG